MSPKRPPKRDTDSLITESLNPSTSELDTCSVRRILELISEEDTLAHKAVGRELSKIEQAVELIAASLRSGGRVFILGAGTSGRLAMMEAAECPPTFGTKPSQIQAIIAGGAKAVKRSIEGAEDSFEASKIELEKRGLNNKDCVIGIAASSSTPFVEGALGYAKSISAATVFITCNPVKNDNADVTVTLLVGPEVITGSTRMKAGTATKMALNMMTTAAMVRMGKTYGNLMVEVAPSSEKLRSRQVRIVMQILSITRDEAANLLSRAERDIKSAVVMHKSGQSLAKAKKLLKQSNGFLRRALEKIEGR